MNSRDWLAAASLGLWGLTLVTLMYFAVSLGVLRFSSLETDAFITWGGHWLTELVAPYAEGSAALTDIQAKEAERRAALIDTLLLMLSIFVIALPTIALPFLYYRQRQRQPIQFQYSHRTNKEMKEHYHKATKVYVAAGEFDWLAEDDDLKNVIGELARESKVKFFSRTSSDQVRLKLGQDDFADCVVKNICVENSEIATTFSAVERGARRFVLYLSETERPSDPNIIGIIPKSRDGVAELVDLIFSLLEKIESLETHNKSLSYEDRHGERPDIRSDPDAR